MKRRLPLTVVTLYLSVQQFYLSSCYGRRSSALTHKQRFLLSDSPATNTNYSRTPIPYLFTLCKKLCVFFTPILTMAVLLGYSTLVKSQTSSGSSIEERIVEQLLEELDEEIDVDEFFEILRYYRRRPLDLNRADEQELAKLLFLSPLQIGSLLEHREQTGKFLSV